MNKIGWCSMTFNPVWGCRNNCPYCYAREFANRFGEKMAFWEMKYKYRNNIKNYYMGDNIDEHYDLKYRLQDFKPTFLERQFNKKFPKKPQRIFIGSMSEIYYWNEEWIEMVIEKVKQYPQHTFIFLSKHMEVYAKWRWPENCFLGVTITKEDDFERQRGSYYFYNGKNIIFFSFEPLLEAIKTEHLKYLDWVIIGAETGNRKGKVIPKREWIEDIVRYCKKNNIPIYLKDSVSLGNIKNIYPEEIKEFPKEVGL